MEETKRERDAPPVSPAVDSAFMNADDDGPALGAGDDDALSRAEALLRARRAQHQGPRAGRTIQSQLRASAAQQRDDSWRDRQLSASGFGPGGASGAPMVESADALAAEQSRAELFVDRQLAPPFLGEAASGAALLTRQRGLVVPLLDPKNDFAVNAAKGSEALRAHKKQRMERRVLKDTIDTAASDMAKIVRGPDAEMTQEEADQLQRRIRLERLRNATDAERRAIADEDRQRQQQQSRADASMAPAAEVAESQTEFTRQNTIAEQRRQLPIFACRAELLRTIRENSVVVVAGETGSGKTTQLVQYLYEAGLAKYGTIGCTQPRRMAAVGVAHRVSREVGCELGREVGYAIRLEDLTSEATKIKFMTDGVLMREVVTDPDVERYSVVVMDEAHERSVNTDVLLGVLKQVARRRGDFKLVVTSATMDLQRFSEFFDHAPIFTIPGRTFPVDLRWERTPVQDYVDQAVLRALEVHTQEEPGDILIFMSGEDDVECTCALLKERLAAHGPAVEASLCVLPCYSVLPSAQQKQILAPAPHGKRKCIVATNIAETSLTIDGIMYVIDGGYMKCKVFKPNVGMNTLSLYPVSKAQASQRSGRAGRTAAGVCFRLYTEFQFHNELIAAPVPEIQRSSVDSVVLLLKSIGADVASFDFIDRPPEANIRSTLYHLWLLGAIDDLGHITREGRLLADFPAEPQLAKVLVSSVAGGCAEEVATVAALLSVDARSIFTLPKGAEEQALAAREKFFAPDSDHVTLLNVFEQYVAHGSSAQWADGHYLNALALRRAVEIRLQFTSRLDRDVHRRMETYQRGSPLPSCRGDTDMVRRAFVAGFFTHAARRDSLATYTTLLSGVPAELHPTSSLNSGGVAPEYVVYNDFVMTGREFMSVVSAVDPAWLVEASGGLFTVKGDTLAAHRRTLMAQRRLATPGALGATAPAPSVGATSAAPSTVAASLATAAAKAPPTAGAPRKAFVPRRR